MAKQTSVDFRGEGLRPLWKRLPERCRMETIALVAEPSTRGAERLEPETSQRVNALVTDRLEVHAEHQQRQHLHYGFAEQAAQLGWSHERLIVIDEDQGQSGALPPARGGFAGVVAAVARGEVGIVMSFELSRNDLDWHHLVYLCRWTNTLIGDERGLYDPSSTSDRVVLGIRGQVSELERDSLGDRIGEARWKKARCGEAFTIPPAGYELDDPGRLQFSSDEAAHAAVRRVFEKSDLLGTARQVFLWCRRDRRPRIKTSYRLRRRIKRGPLHAGGPRWQNKHLLIFAARGCAPCGSGCPSAAARKPSLWSPS